MQEHIKEMAQLQRSLLLQQHQVQMANLERQKDAVRDEIEQVAQMLIHSRQNVRAERNSQGLAGSSSHSALKEMLRRNGKKFESLPSHQAIAWHQRFTDNFRLRKLQHQALRLRGPVLMPKGS